MAESKCSCLFGVNDVIVVVRWVLIEVVGMTISSFVVAIAWEPRAVYSTNLLGLGLCW